MYVLLILIYPVDCENEENSSTIVNPGNTGKKNEKVTPVDENILGLKRSTLTATLTCEREELLQFQDSNKRSKLEAEVTTADTPIDIATESESAEEAVSSETSPNGVVQLSSEISPDPNLEQTLLLISPLKHMPIASPHLFVDAGDEVEVIEAIVVANKSAAPVKQAQTHQTKTATGAAKGTAAGMVKGVGKKTIGSVAVGSKANIMSFFKKVNPTV